jgi:hypothetical protein
MTMFHGNMLSWRRTVRQLTITLTLAAAATSAALAQAPSTPPYALFQYSTLTGTGNTINATWLPVVTSSGTIYLDMTLLFDVDSTGKVTVAPGYPKSVPSPMPIVSHFKAGTYVGPADDSNFIITVSGPAVAKGGDTEWTSLIPSSGSILTHPGSCTWYVGPLASSPLAARIKQAGIPSNPYMSYGVCDSYEGPDWASNVLVGVSQVGSSITFASFTDGNGDHSQPVDSIPYILQTN